MSLERRHLPLIFSSEYVVADKSDGVRYTLFLTQSGGQSYSLLVDRKLECLQIPVAANKSAFLGSLFDGEVVWQRAQDNARETQAFLIFDVAAYKGSRDVQSWNYYQRLALIRTIFDLDGRNISSLTEASQLAKEGKIICGGNAHGLSFRPKPCLPLSQLDTLVRQLGSLPYATDGLVFTPVSDPVRTGTTETTFKLKTCHTIDLELREGHFYVGAGGTPDTAANRIGLSSIGVALRVDDDFWTELEAATDLSKLGGTIIVECRMHTSPQGETLLAFARLRSDKSHPNSVRTVLATLTNLRENIQVDELLAGTRSFEPERTSARCTLQSSYV